MELFYQEKEFVAGHMSGNGQLGINSWETRGACKGISSPHEDVVLEYSCICSQPSAFTGVETRRHD